MLRTSAPVQFQSESNGQKLHWNSFRFCWASIVFSWWFLISSGFRDLWTGCRCTVLSSDMLKASIFFHYSMSDALQNHFDSLCTPLYSNWTKFAIHKKCCQDKCCQDKCCQDICLGNLPLKFGQNRVSNRWYIADIEFVWVVGGGVHSHFHV